MPQPILPRTRRDHRMNFDASTPERRAMYEAAYANGLSFTAWARSTLLREARAVFADSKQHPTLYTNEAIARPPATREEPPKPVVAAPIDPKPTPPPTPPATPRRPRPWEPYGDSDGLDSPDDIPGAKSVPGLGTVKFQ